MCIRDRCKANPNRFAASDSTRIAWLIISGPIPSPGKTAIRYFRMRSTPFKIIVTLSRTQCNYSCRSRLERLIEMCIRDRYTLPPPGEHSANKQNPTHRLTGLTTPSTGQLSDSAGNPIFKMSTTEPKSVFLKLLWQRKAESLCPCSKK